jgi:hypothetical protein
MEILAVTPFFQNIPKGAQYSLVASGTHDCTRLKSAFLSRYREKVSINCMATELTPHLHSHQSPGEGPQVTCQRGSISPRACRPEASDAAAPPQAPASRPGSLCSVGSGVDATAAR